MRFRFIVPVTDQTEKKLQNKEKLSAENDSEDSTVNSNSISEAIELLCNEILNNLSQQYTIEDLAKKSGYSSRMIHYGFMRYTNCSPAKWIMKERLTKAREMILSKDSQSSISSIAHQLGFTSSSKFSSYYRRMHGESPSETLKNLKSSRS